MRYFIGVVVLALVAVGAYYAWDAYGGSVQQENPETPEIPEQISSARYATSTFSIEYPGNFTVDESYAYEGVPNKPISGVKFTVPAELTAATNLSPDSGISVEWLPRANACTGDIYILANVSAHEMKTASTTYSVATTTEGAAGNTYEEHVYAIPESDPCTAVRYLIHTSNFTNYGPGEEGSPEIREYDHGSLLRTFDGIRDSLILN